MKTFNRTLRFRRFARGSLVSAAAFLALACGGSAVAQTQIWIPAQTTQIWHPGTTTTVWVPPVYQTVQVPETTRIDRIPASTKIVQHPAGTKIVHHDAVTTYIHHPAVTHTVHHDLQIGVNHFDAVSHLVHHPASTHTVHVEGYWEPNWVDPYYDEVWIDGHFESYWQPEGDDPGAGYWADYYVEGGWVTIWVGGYWDDVWVEGYDYLVTDAEPWDETVVDSPAHDDYYLISPAYNEEVVDEAAYDEPVTTPAYDEPVPTPPYDETVVVPEHDETVVVPATTRTVLVSEGRNDTVTTPGWPETIVVVPGYWFIINQPMIAKRVADRDDAMITWSGAQERAPNQPIYAGKTTGDMVAWRVAGVVGENITYAWSASGPEEITGPSGSGKSEWSIRDGDDDTTKEWLDWKPGTYTIRCSVTAVVNGEQKSYSPELVQKVGVRTDDVVVVAWIDPLEVTIPNASSAQAGLPDVFLPQGLVASDTDSMKWKAALLARHIKDEGVNAAFNLYSLFIDETVSLAAFSAADKTYALHWIFKHTANFPGPESDLSQLITVGSKFVARVDQSRYQQFVSLNSMTRHKLINRFQAKYLVGDLVSPGMTNIQPESLVCLHNEAWIGNSKDPCRLYEVWGSTAAELFGGYPANGVFLGKPSPRNSMWPLIDDKWVKLRNEGRPNDDGLKTLKNLTGYDQGEIWSSITFFSDMAYYSDTNSLQTGRNLTRNPRPQVTSEGRINTQVYPTYWFYINGEKSQSVQVQASAPGALFPNPDTVQ